MTRAEFSRILVSIVVLTTVFGTFPPGTTVVAQQSAGLSPQAMAQIQAMTIEKVSRTPAQQKMASQLVHAAKMARGEQVAAGIATLQVYIPDVNSRGAVLDVRADVSDALLASMRALGAEILDVSEVYRSVRIRVPLGQADAIAALTDVSFVQPKQEVLTSRIDLVVPGLAPRVPDRLRTFQERERIDRARIIASVHQAVEGGEWQLSVGSRNSEGDLTHGAAAARAMYGVNGAGVKIGVISDGVTNLSATQASGDLGPVTVLQGQAGTGDEGTAMLEIVHDLAPNAELYFATAINSLAGFAQNIRNLAAAGCTIIVDDAGYFVESPFQDGQVSTSQTNGGIVAQSVKDVAAAGVLYFSAAANSGNKNDNTSGTWEGDFLNGGAATGPLVGAGQVHNFGGQAFNVLVSSGATPISLFWSDPLGSSANDYDLYRLNSTGTTILGASTGFQTGTQDPLEIMTGGSAGDRIVIVQYSGAGRFLHLNTNRNRLTISTAGNIHGHAATSAPNSFGVAAAPAQSPGPYPGRFNSGNKVETFSSDGPRRIFFTQTGAAITPGNFTSTGGQVLQKPDITAADGVSVTGVGGFPSPFFGTSAAAPHAAAIAALVQSRNLMQTATQVRTALLGSAIDIETAGVDRDSGVGIIMADTAVAAVMIPLRRDGDFNGDGSADISVFRPSTGVWYIRGFSTTTWGGGADIPVAGDYDGDGRADVAVFRPSTGVWYIVQSSTATGVVVTWGGGADIPVPGDYDGDSKTDVAVFRPSTGSWFILRSSTGIGLVFTWGGGADVPSARDYDGDRITDPAVFRPSTGVWYILLSSTATGFVTTWGGSGDIPVSADFDGDRKADISVFRPSTGIWYILRSLSGIGSVATWGGGADVPVPGDYDADGKDDLAVFRPSTGEWFIIQSGTSVGVIVTWGGGADIPILKRP